jgi:hypothetical protein
MGGSIDVMFDTAVTAIPNVKAGTLRALAVASPRRTSIAPELPTLAESLPGFEADSWNGLMVPACCRRYKSAVIRWRGGGFDFFGPRSADGPVRGHRLGGVACCSGVWAQNGSSGSNSGGWVIGRELVSPGLLYLRPVGAPQGFAQGL